jgi:hypothetical protein
METNYTMEAKLHGMEYKKRTPVVVTKEGRDKITEAIEARRKNSGRQSR